MSNVRLRKGRMSVFSLTATALTAVERVYRRFGRYVERSLMGGVAVLSLSRVFPQYRYVLPPTWVGLLPFIIVVSFLPSESLGLSVMWLVLGWLLAAELKSLGVLLFLLSYLGFYILRAVSRKLVGLVFPSLRTSEASQGRSSIGATSTTATRGNGAAREGVVTFLAPWLVLMNLGPLIPLLSGLAFGRRGVFVAASCALLSLVVFSLAGFTFWGVAVPGGTSSGLLELTFPTQRNASLTRMFSGPASWITSLGVSPGTKWALYVPDVSKISYVLDGIWTIIKQHFVTHPLLFMQVFLWAFVAFCVVHFQRGRNSVSKAVTGVGVAASLYFLAYVALPLILGDKVLSLVFSGKVWPFAYVVIVTAGLALLPEAVGPSALNSEGDQSSELTLSREAGPQGDSPTSFAGGSFRGSQEAGESQSSSGPLLDPTKGISKKHGDSKGRGKDDDGKIKIEL